MIILLSVTVSIMFGISLGISYAWYAYENASTDIKVATKKDDSFLLGEENEKINAQDIYYVLARFIDETTIKYYIYESAEVAKKISEYHIEYNSHLKRDGTPRDNNSMRELMIDEEHLERWDLLTN